MDFHKFLCYGNRSGKVITLIMQMLKDELESVKEEIEENIEEEYIPYTDGYTKRTLDPKVVIEIIDKRIKELEQ